MAEHVSAEVLSAYLDGQLKEKEKDSVAQHLEKCGPCRDQLERLRGVKQRAAQGMPLKPMPAFVAAALKTRAAERLAQRSKAPVPWLRILVPASLAISIFFYAWWHNEKEKRQSIPMDGLLAAHYRYMEESPVAPTDLSSDSFANKLMALKRD